ncbi:unnamed protein product [Paramecium sonneborni]|uniref:Transmembrane protein n=1 Tax=Paramecium sonneborni TaxID=65129 RepID=A0A8S1QLX5_9CILI|nr:unnamed protein product [Paramecium sonneborni]
MFQIQNCYLLLYMFKIFLEIIYAILITQILIILPKQIIVLMKLYINLRRQLLKIMNLSIEIKKLGQELLKKLNQQQIINYKQKQLFQFQIRKRINQITTKFESFKHYIIIQRQRNNIFSPLIFLKWFQQMIISRLLILYYILTCMLFFFESRLIRHLTFQFI